MATLDILRFPDPRLRNRAKTVDNVDDSIRRLADDMLETMYEAPGIGLAATQVNVAKRVIVVDVSEKQDEPLVLQPNESVEVPAAALALPLVRHYVEVKRLDIVGQQPRMSSVILSR